MDEMIIERFAGTLVHNVPDCGTVKVEVAPERVRVELDYARALTLIGERVKAIKHLREVLKVGLKQAHRMTEAAAKERQQRRSGSTTNYTLTGRAGSNLLCNSCGFEEGDFGQTECRGCGRTLVSCTGGPND